MTLSRHLIHAIATAVAEHHSGNDSTGSTSTDEELDMKEALHKKTKIPVIATISPCNASKHDIFRWPPLALLPYMWCSLVLMHKYLVMIPELNLTLTLIPLLLVLIHDYEQPIHVHGYTGEVSPDENCCIVSAVVAYDHPETGGTFMLVFNQAILINKLPTNLVSPMQLHDVGIRVYDEPKSMALKPIDNHNAIVIPDNDDGITLRIPLRIQGVITYFHIHKPTKDEFESCDNWIEMTANSPDWDPSTNRFQEQEDAILDDYGRLHEQLEK